MTSDAALNITNVYLSATDSEVSEGMRWYNDAYDIASTYSPNDVWRGAGVIAAYSPLTPWWRNVELAIDSLSTGEANPRSLGTSVRTAQRILDGEHPLDVMRGDKVRSFCTAIATNGETDIVTIDRHAYDIAMGAYHTDTTRKIGKRVYRELSDAYREVADLTGLHAAQVQAITWVAWRNRKGVTV